MILGLGFGALVVFLEASKQAKAIRQMKKVTMAPRKP
jgi:hypothetical protein